MLRKLFLTFALVFLFAMGQQGALVHEISHYADLGSGLAPASQQQDKAPHSPACDKCFSYGELANALAVSDFVVPEIAGANTPIAAVTGQLLNHNSSPYSARAPPRFA